MPFLFLKKKEIIIIKSQYVLHHKIVVQIFTNKKVQIIITQVTIAQVMIIQKTIAQAMFSNSQKFIISITSINVIFDIDEKLEETEIIDMNINNDDINQILNVIDSVGYIQEQVKDNDNKEKVKTYSF